MPQLGLRNRAGLRPADLARASAGQTRGPGKERTRAEGSVICPRAMRWGSTLAVGAVSLLVSFAAEASPEDLFGYGGRTSAMGATGVAHASGYESAWHNPALASTVRENKLTLGYGGAVFALDAL